jgi:hypothetical protein
MLRIFHLYTIKLKQLKFFVFIYCFFFLMEAVTFGDIQFSLTLQVLLYKAFETYFHDQGQQVRL